MTDEYHFTAALNMILLNMNPNVFIMKKALFILYIIPVLVFTQTTEDLGVVAPIHDGLIAIKKDSSWGFINENGVMVINYRNDLVPTNSKDGSYPIFNNNRCLISEKKDGVTYFGYIDKTGKTVIKPQFLNASNFDNNLAVVLLLVKEELGRNEILGKNVISHRYFEIVIDSIGITKEYLNPKGTNVVLDKKFLRKPPKITSKKVSKHIYAVLNENKKWSIVIVN